MRKSAETQTVCVLVSSRWCRREASGSQRGKPSGSRAPAQEMGHRGRRPWQACVWWMERHSLDTHHILSFLHICSLWKISDRKKKSAKPNSAGLLLHSGGQALHSWVASAQASCSHMGPHAQQKPAPHALLPRGRQQLCLPTAVSAHGASPSPVPLCLPQPGLTPHCPSQCRPGAGARKAWSVRAEPSDPAAASPGLLVAETGEGGQAGAKNLPKKLVLNSGPLCSELTKSVNTGPPVSWTFYKTLRCCKTPASAGPAPEK